MAHSDPHKKINVWLPADEAEELERLAVLADRSLTAEVRRAIRQYLERQEATTHA